MSTDTMYNAPPSAATPSSVPPAPLRPASDSASNSVGGSSSQGGRLQLADVNLSEGDYLAREAQRAKDALTDTIAHLKTSLAQAGDIKLWTRKYPWAALGVAAAAGFTAAAVVTPKRGEKLTEKLSSVANKFSPGATPEGQSSTPETQAASAAARPMLAATLMSSLFDLVRTAIEKTIEASSHSMQNAQAAADHAAEQATDAVHARTTETPTS